MNMSYSYVIDTYAWVEYFSGSRRGRTAKEYIENGKSATPTIAVMELTKWFLKEIETRRRTLEEMNLALGFVRATTLLVDLDMAMARKAGETDFLMKKKVRNWPMADSIVYTTASTAGAQVVTGDLHFKPIENAIIL
jgi:predicted nucleic acid-binding protein